MAGPNGIAIHGSVCISLASLGNRDTSDRQTHAPSVRLGLWAAPVWVSAMMAAKPAAMDVLT